MDKIKIEKYNGVDLFYNKEDGRIYFDFEGEENETKYVFEAKKIIDNPRWEECNLMGYFIDGVFDDYIGTAIAKRKDMKSGKPDWLIKGEYDSEHKETNFHRMDKKIYPKNEKNDEVYKEFIEQKKVVLREERKLKEIIRNLE